MPFEVGVTRDICRPDGPPVFTPADLAPLGTEGLNWSLLADDQRELTPKLLREFDGLFHFSPAVTRASLEGIERLVILAHIGVGVDMVDIDSCTEAGIVVTVTPDAVTRPMASAATTLVLALAHRLVERNGKLHAGEWNSGRFDLKGVELRGRTLGVVGFGRIGREVVRLLAPWDMHVLVATPHLSREEAIVLGVRSVELDLLLGESNVVIIACPLRPDTHHLIDERRLALMRPDAFLINVARGQIIDQTALVEALQSNRIAGAGLDVFENEPIDENDPLLELHNVVGAPHSLGYTDELFRGCARASCEAILGIARGRVPSNVVNVAVLENSRFKEKIRRLTTR